MHILEKGKVTIKEATIDFFKGIFNLTFLFKSNIFLNSNRIDVCSAL